MTSENPQPPPLVPNIDYGRPDPRPEPPGGCGAVSARMAVGFIGYTALSILWFFVASGMTNAWWGLTVWAYGTIALLGFTLWLRLARGYKGYGYGILTALFSAILLGLGVLVLIIGTCTGTFR